MLWQRLNKAFPALAFFGGFLWDALTLGRSVGGFDLFTLALYLAGAAALLWYLARKHHLHTRSAARTENVPQPGLDPSPTARSAIAADSAATAASEASAAPPHLADQLSTRIQSTWSSTLATTRHWLFHDGPYFALQFCFGGLFSALFIFYFKSSSHLSAYLVTLGLGALLVANEFLEDQYGRFTLTWLFFGLCSMLLLNFALPHLVGSLHPFWFYASTALGVGLTYALRHYAPGRPGRITPVILLAVALVGAYGFDIIPPVPLVKKGLAVGHAFTKRSGRYQILIETPPWYAFWRAQNQTVHLAPGERLYCVSSVFAPQGMQTRLYHRWSYRDPKQGWKVSSRIGFGVSGGRHEGFRGYTYKQTLRPGHWKVEVETEDGRTVSRHDFNLETTDSSGASGTRIWEM